VKHKRRWRGVSAKNGIMVLNSDYTFLNMVNWKQAIKLIAKGKVEVLKATTRMVRNAERTWEIWVPKIMRLVKMIRTLYKSKVPFSKRNVFVRDGFQCCYCGTSPNKCQAEHIIPKSRGGKCTWENIVTACKECNDKKRDRTPREANMFLNRQPVQPTVMEFLQIRLKSLGAQDILDEYLQSC